MELLASWMLSIASDSVVKFPPDLATVIMRDGWSSLITLLFDRLRLLFISMASVLSSKLQLTSSERAGVPSSKMVKSTC